MDDLKKLVTEQVDAQRADLIDLSLRIHANPELGLEEAKASALLTQYLEDKGFETERGICGLDTAFKASYGRGAPAIAFVAEYDALPVLGHACGHNIIAAAAVGAAVATLPAVDRVGGSVMVIGTPGEEFYGCKQTMVERGAFAGVDVAMMIHPGTRNIVAAPALACSSLEVEFFGKAAHAAACPDEGVNALEALILAFNNINSLRQHIRNGSRIHGIILKGGEAANIVPAYSKAVFLVRAEDGEYLEELREKALNCFVSASLATGARLKHKWGEVTYAPLRCNSALAEIFRKNVEPLGRKLDPFDTRRRFGSTDMGNVSQVVPSLHSFLAIAPPEVLAHSPEFAAAAASEEGHRGLLDGAKALALTGTDLLTNQPLLDSVREEFSREKSGGLP